MIPKQDRQGVRHAKEIEQKYDLNKDYSAIERIAIDARTTATVARALASEANHLAKTTAERVDSLSISSVSSNPNLLDNSFFGNCVNQRGQTSYSGEGYWIDRWLGKWNGDGVLTLHEQGTANGRISLYRSAHNAHIGQIVPNIDFLAGKQLTLSVIGRVEAGGSLGIHISVMNDSDFNTYVDYASVEYSNTDKQLLSYSFTVPSGYNQLLARFTSGNGKSAMLYAAKLEVGAVSTLEADVPPNFQQELAKCQRYYYTAKNLAISAFAVASNNIRFGFYCPSNLHRTPSVRCSGVNWVYQSGYNTNVGGNLALNDFYGNALQLSLQLTSGSVAANSAALVLLSDIIVEADL